MGNYENITILIPAYNPDHKLVDLVNQMIREKFKRIIIVNDGSKPECMEIFNSLAHFKECTILKHAVNLGKGRTLKTAFNYFLNNHEDTVGLVTVDADGQHKIDDIKKVAAKLDQHPDRLILGVRDFSAENIPFRSRFGNVMTRRVFRLACGIKISDTQTGLRGLPIDFLKDIMNVNGERFEYEMNMLIESKQQNVAIEEVEIQTVYIEENKSSHFNPVIDSLKIYSVFLKYLSSSLLSFGLDILLFSLLSVLLKDIIPAHFIIAATIGARAVSSLFNYFINRNAVFHSTSKNTLLKYYLLSVSQMLISAFAVYSLYSLFGNGEVALKIAVDTILFIASFYIQREWVFKNKQEQKRQLGGGISL